MAGARTRNNLPRTRAADARPPGRLRRLTDAGIAALRSHPRISAGGGAVVVIGIAALVLLLSPASSHGYQPAARARSYADYTACLLTDSTGVTGTAAAPVWAGMEAASHTTSEQVSYLSMQGPDTAANADTYINTLALRGCDVIVTAGPVPTQGADDRASAYPKLHFLTVATGGANVSSSATPSAPANVGVIPSGATAAIQSSVAATLVGLFGKS